jgi:hypothetical protein
MRTRFLAGLLVAALWLLGSQWAGSPADGRPILGTQAVWAASPEPTPVIGGDPRSPGEGPGFVGAPLLAILVVIALGIGTTILTVLYVRFTAGRRNRPGPGR